jgi:hypothetical protein
MSLMSELIKVSSLFVDFVYLDQDMLKLDHMNIAGAGASSSHERYVLQFLLCEDREKRCGEKILKCPHTDWDDPTYFRI